MTQCTKWRVVIEGIAYYIDSVKKNGEDLMQEYLFSEGRIFFDVNGKEQDLVVLTHNMVPYERGVLIFGALAHKAEECDTGPEILIVAGGESGMVRVARSPFGKLCVFECVQVGLFSHAPYTGAGSLLTASEVLARVPVHSGTMLLIARVAE